MDFAAVFGMLAAEKEDILQAGAQAAQVAAGGSKPDVEQVKHGAFMVARDKARAIFDAQLRKALGTAVAMFPLLNGPRVDEKAVDYNDPAYTEWREKFDAHLMSSIGEDMLKGVGQDFIGEYLTDSELDDVSIFDTAIKAGADNLVANAVRSRQPGQVLAEIGIVAEDLARFGAPSAAPSSGPAPSAAQVAAAQIDEPTARAHVERLVGAYAIKVGIASLNVASLTEQLKGAFDDDPFLPLSYIEQLGGMQADAPYFAAYFRAANKEAVSNTVSAAMLAAMTGVLPEPAVAAKKPKKEKQLKAGEVSPPAPPAPPPPLSSVSAETAPVAVVGDADDYRDVIKLIRTHASDTDEEIGGFVGKSRATINNIVTSKKETRPLKLTPEQRATLKAHLQERAAGLNAAILRLA